MSKGLTAQILMGLGARIARKLDLAALGAACLVALVSLPIAAQPVQNTILFSPDITVILDGQTLDDQNVAEDDLTGAITPIAAGALPANVDLQAYHRSADPAAGDLLVLDTSTNLPGGVFATPRKVIGLNGGVFSEIMDLADCGVPSGVGIDAMTRDATMWFSFDTPVTLGGQLFNDEDIAALSASCVWSQAFDGSMAGVASSLDVDGIHFQPETGLLLISFDTTGTVGGVAFDDEDVLSHELSTNVWAMVYDGSALHPGGGWRSADLDALDGTATGIVDPDPDPEPEPDPEPTLRVSPSSLSFELKQGSPAASKAFTVQAVNGEIAYTIQPGASWLSANPGGGSSNGEVDSFLVTVNPAGLPPGVYSRPLFISGGGKTRQLLVTLVVTPGDGPPPPLGPSVSENGAVNAASMTPFGLPGHPMSPQSAVAIFGLRFTDGEYHAETIPLPVDLGGVFVTFDGIRAGLFYASPGQLVVQLPGELLELPGIAIGGTTTMVVTNALGSSEPRIVQLNTFSPAIYTLTQTGSGQGIVVFSNSLDVAAPVGAVAASRPAKEGDYLTIYANGLGPVDPEIEDRLNSCEPDGQCLPDLSNVVRRTTLTRPTVTIGGVRVPDKDVAYSGLAALFVALNEIVVRVPAGVPTGDAIPILIEMEGISSRADVTIAVE